MTRTKLTETEIAAARAFIEAECAREAVERKLNRFDRALRDFDRGIPVIVAAIEAGSVPNPVYKDARSDLAHAFEDTTRRIFWERPKDVNLLPTALETAWSMSPALHNVPGAIRRLEALDARFPGTDFVEKRLECLRIFLPIANAVEEAKALTIKRQLPSKDILPAWAPPPASMKAQRAVYDSLVAFTNDAHEELVRKGVETRHRLLERYLEVEKEAAPGTRFDFSFLEKFFGPKSGTVSRILAIVMKKGSHLYTRPIERAQDWEERLLEDARKDADEIRNRFVGKNQVKLASIVDGKGGLREVAAGRREVQMGSLEGEIIVSFDDGSTFRAHNTIVWSTSVHGRPYVRFPLTFHDVRLADGSEHAFMSEEEMNDVFLAAPEETEDETQAPAGP